MAGTPPLKLIREKKLFVFEVAEVVDQHVAEPAADHDTERRPQQKVVDVDRRADLRRLDDQTADVAPSEHKAGDVGERIPAQRERPNLEQNRINDRIRNDERHRSERRRL